MSDDKHKHNEHGEHGRGKRHNDKHHDERPDEKPPKDEAPDEAPTPPRPAPPIVTPPGEPGRPEPPLPPPPRRKLQVIQTGLARFGQQLVIVIRPDYPTPDVQALYVLAQSPALEPALVQLAQPWSEVRQSFSTGELHYLHGGHLMLDEDRVIVILDPTKDIPDLAPLLAQCSDPEINWDKVQRGASWETVRR